MRIRTIKPEFWTHPVMTRQSDAAKLLAIGLLNYADDEGFFYADPRMVRAALRPLDEDSTSVRAALADLSKIGYLDVREHVSHGPIGRVVSFLEHQRIDRAQPSKVREFYDACCAQVVVEQVENTFADDSTNDRRSLVTNVSQEWKGMEGNGTGKGMDMEAGRKPAKKQSTASPSKPSNEAEAIAFFAQQGASAEQAATFFDHFEANGWKQGGKTPIKDWRAAARNWIRRSFQGAAAEAIRAGIASRGAAAGLGGVNREKNLSSGRRGAAERTEEFTKLPVVGVDVGVDEVAALASSSEGAS